MNFNLNENKEVAVFWAPETWERQ